MKAGLICSDKNRAVLTELLAARNISLDDQAGVYIVESGSDIPPGKISILFEWSNMNSLIELMEILTKAPDETMANIIGKSGEEKYEVITLPLVFYFEARGNNAFCITAEGEYKVREKLYELEGRLPKNRFVRVGKSFIVNIGTVKEIIPWFGRRLMLRFVNSKKEIEVSKNYVRNFKEFLGM